MINNLSAYSFTNNDVLTLYGLASGTLTPGTLDPQTVQTRDGGYLPPPVSIVYTPREIDGEDSLVFDSYLSEASTVSVNLSTTSTCVNVATGYDLFNLGYELLIEEKGQVLDRVDTFNYNNTFNIVCSASLISNWVILSGAAIYNKVTTSLSGTGLDLLPVGLYSRAAWPYDTLTVKYYLPIEESAPIFWPNELLNVYKTKKIVWDMFSTRLGGEDLKNTFIPFNLNETTYVVDQPRNLFNYSTRDYLTLSGTFSFSGVQIDNTIENYYFTGTEYYYFGDSVDTSDDGTRVVVGAHDYFKNIIGQGLVRVYQLINSTWIQMGQDLIGEGSYDNFGFSVSMNGDGSRIAVGAYGAGASDNGATKIYEWSGTLWVQVGQTITGANNTDWSGYSIQLNSVGDRVVIAERFGDAGGYESGQVKVYEYNGSLWVQMGQTIPGGMALDEISTVAINSVGDIIAYGSPGAQGDFGFNVGVVRGYKWDGAQWNQIGQDVYGDGDHYLLGFYSLSLNGAGDIFAVSGVGNNGSVLVYKYNGTSWELFNDFSGSSTSYITYGYSVSLNSTGDRIAIGQPQRFIYSRGAVEVYEYNGTYWEKIIVDIQGPVNGTSYVFFGRSVSLNKNGDKLTVGAPAISGGQVFNYQLPQYPLVGLSSFSAYKSVVLWSDGVVTENSFTYPFYLPDGTYGSSAGVINFRKFTTPGEYTILSNTFYYRNSVGTEIILSEPYNITFVVS